MDAKKYIFDNLDAFVNGRFAELRDYEEMFYHQLFVLKENLKLITCSRTKLEVLCNRFRCMKMLQQTIDNTLDQIQNWQSKWEKILNNLEAEIDIKGIKVDQSRAFIYHATDKLFTTLSNYYEMLESINSKVADYYTKKNEEPLNLIFEIMNLNVYMLDKLYSHMQKLKFGVNINQQIQEGVIRNYRYCHCY